jgi:hypothetical protein
MKSIVNGIVISVVLLFLAVSVRAQDYEIRLQRPKTAGQTYRVSVSGSEQNRMTMDINSKTEQKESENKAIDFESIVTILEIGKQGAPVKESHKIVKCERLENDSRLALVPPGTVVTAFLADKKQQFTIEGTEVSPEAKEVLDMVITLDDVDYSEDEAFGTKERKKIGDSWPINIKLAMEELRSSGLDFTKGDFSGKVTLAGIGGQDATPYLILNGEIVVNQIDIPVGPEVYTDKSHGRFTFAAKYPLDHTMGVLEEISNFSIDATMKNKPEEDYPDMTVHVYAEQTITKTFKY